MKAIASAIALSFLTACTPQQRPLTLYDDFAHAQEQGVTTHGELVEGVLIERSLTHQEITRQQVTLVAHETLDQGLDAYVKQRFLTPMQATAQQLEQQQPGVVSQSQGASDSRIVEALYNRQDWREQLEQQLHLSNPSEKQFLQALVERVSRIRKGPEIQQARAQLIQAGLRAQDHGVARFISAGNQGELSRTFDRLGILVDKDFYTNYLADPSATIVGAADNDQVAAIASPNAGAMLAADGVEVSVMIDGHLQKETGSSYATPQVALVARRGYNAGIDAEELGPRLVASADHVGGAEPWLGAGTLSEEGFWLLP